MGSRGMFNKTLGKTGGVPIEKRIYSCIGRLCRIKIIQCDKLKNNPTITYSNTANTTYFSYSKESHKIERIYYFRNHKLYKSVDFKSNETPHSHYWNNGVVGRKKHDKHNIHALSDRDLRLMNYAIEFNQKHIQEWKMKF